MDGNLMEIGLVYKEGEHYKIEKVDAEKVDDFFQLKAMPAFASGVAYNDIISVEQEGKELFFDEVIHPSGHSVLHIVILKPENSSLFLASLISFGLNINYLHNNTYLVIDVPPAVLYKNLREYLLEEFDLGNIDIEEACISDLHFASIT